jgi:hypothetical protein
MPRHIVSFLIASFLAGSGSFVKLHSKCYKHLSTPACSFRSSLLDINLTPASCPSFFDPPTVHPLSTHVYNDPTNLSMMLSYENRPTMAPSTPATSDHLPLSPSSSNLSNGPSMSNGKTNKYNQPETTHHHIWLITGPAGCGKSTVAQFIAKTMNLPYIEGDEVFSPVATFVTRLTAHSTTQRPTSTRWQKAYP